MSRINIKSHSGSTMVESAIYVPIMILAAMFVIYMCINMYSAAAAQSHLHMSLREEGLKRTGTGDIGQIAKATTDRYRAAAMAKPVSYSEDRTHNLASLTGSLSDTYKGGRLTKGDAVTRRFTSYIYLFSESDFVRTREVIDEMLPR